LQAVTKKEFQWLIKNHHIKQERGQLLDVVTSNGKSRKRTRWVTDATYEKLKYMKDMNDMKGLK
jgi:hypothetical protein